MKHYTDRAQSTEHRDELIPGHIFYPGGGSEGITIEGGKKKKEEGEKEHLPFISIAYFASSLYFIIKTT
jgi:hypothetical protein